MNQTYVHRTRKKQTARYLKSEIPTCFRQKTVWTTLLDYALTAASVIGLLTAIIFVIAI
jgi:hypothetical protein